MNITVKNYLEERAKIDFSKLPEKYKKVDEFITEAIDFYGQDAEIDKTIDEGIKQLNGLHVAKEPDKIKTLVEKKPEKSLKIKASDVKEGVRFINPEGTIFIIDKVGKYDTGETAVESSLEGGKKGNYKNEIGDFVDFLNEEKAEIYEAKKAKKDDEEKQAEKEIWEKKKANKKETEEKKPTPEEVAAQKEEFKKEVESELHKIVSGGDMSMADIVAEGRRINETRSFRSQFIDNGSDNKRRLTPTKENLVRWLKNPGKFDLIGVDTASKTDATADLKHVKKETILHLIGFKK